MTTDKAAVDERLTSEKILEVARDQVRRFGEAKTNVVDIARALGTSHTTIYRRFRSKAEVFDAIVGEAMQDEEELARTFVDSEGAASERLEGLVLALHKRKLERFTNDPEVYQLYRRVVDERPGLIQDYAARMTKLIARILADGVRKKGTRSTTSTRLLKLCATPSRFTYTQPMSKQLRSWDTDWSRR